MLPSFTEQGLLPTGVHFATFEEFEQRFAYFDRSDRRFRLFDRFRELFHQAKGSGIVRRLAVGGSFITAKPEPNGIDCILIMDPAFASRELSPIEYNLVSRPRARRLFGGDVIAVVEGSADCQYYLAVFQRTRQGESVGIVEIEL